MDRVKMLLFATLFLCWTSQALSDGQCKPQCAVTQKTFGPSKPLNIAVVGVAGEPGRRGVPGAPGTPCTESSVQNCTSLLMDIQTAFTKCGIYSTSWRRVAHIDMTDPAARCPSGLKNSSDTNEQPACGKSADGDACVSLTFPTGWRYTHVCGHVRGYQVGETKGFNFDHDGNVDGVQITIKNQQKPLWAYAVSKSANSDMDNAPCSPNKTTGELSENLIDIFEDNYCCEIRMNKNGWEGPLWAGGYHNTSGNDGCKDNHFWFHRQVDYTSKSIKVKWCASSGTAVFTDILEIWVL